MKSKMKELEVEQMERTNSSSLCHCGVPAALRTSWTKDNLGRSSELAPMVGEGWLSELPPVFMYHLTTLIAGGCVEAL
ncbi:hypothetical protein V6N11_001874 [Hibiscus sabdariffa]|uniref:Uncharacterized protein n=1 Tax=Hibiscus sabdariffa TaxID=183260 RepID=A0ABR2QTR6_9ROSI